MKLFLIVVLLLFSQLNFASQAQDQRDLSRVSTAMWGTIIWYSGVFVSIYALNDFKQNPENERILLKLGTGVTLMTAGAGIVGYSYRPENSLVLNQLRNNNQNV